MEIDFHFIHERVTNKEFQVKFIHSDQQIIDLLTKALPQKRFLWLNDKLNLQPWLSLRGDESHAKTPVSGSDPTTQTDSRPNQRPKSTP